MTTSPLKGNIDVLEIIKKKNYQTDLLKKQLDIKKEVIDTFIDYLDIKGLLVATPIKNFMSSSLSVIDG